MTPERKAEWDKAAKLLDKAQASQKERDFGTAISYIQNLVLGKAFTGRNGEGREPFVRDLLVRVHPELSKRAIGVGGSKLSLDQWLKTLREE